MTEKEKADKYDQIAAHLWAMAEHGNMLQSTVASGLIQVFDIGGPNGELPEEC